VKLTELGKVVDWNLLGQKLFNLSWL